MSKYTTIEEARTAGLFHPNCGHSVSVYIEGLTTRRKIEPDPEGYARRQNQRKAERNAKKWNKRRLVAISPEEKKRATAKWHEWNKEIKNLKTQRK